MKQIYSIFGIIVLVTGCSTYTPPPVMPNVVEVVKKDAPIVVSATIVEGKTTRQDLLEQLGTPDLFSEPSFDYDFDEDNNKVCKLELKTRQNLVINEMIGKGYKHDKLSIMFEVDKNTGKFKNTVYSVSLY
jgi:outer membrane protein assembly factor BamE (lipoprotein component of BamABCDE complex)